MKTLIPILLLVFTLIASAADHQPVTQKIRAKQIRKGEAELIWRQGDGYEWFTIRVPAGDW